MEIKSETLLKMFDLEDLYEDLTKDIDKSNPGFNKTQRELNLITFEASTKFRDFFASVNILNYWGRFMMFVLYPYKEELVEEPENVIKKIDQGMAIFNQLLGLKAKFHTIISQLHCGIRTAKSIRSNLLYILRKFEKIEEFDYFASSDTESSTSIQISSVFLVILVLLNNQY